MQECWLQHSNLFFEWRKDLKSNSYMWMMRDEGRDGGRQKVNSLFVDDEG